MAVIHTLQWCQAHNVETKRSALSMINSRPSYKLPSLSRAQKKSVKNTKIELVTKSHLWHLSNLPERSFPY